MRRWIVLVIMLMATGVGACGAGSTSVELRPSDPSGPSVAVSTYAVDTITFTVVDSSRPAPASSTQAGASTRTIPVKVWFPRADGPFPLVEFSHGLGGGSSSSEALMGEWASAGYVVVAPMFPLSNFATPGGADLADVANQPGDVSAVLDEVIARSSVDGPLRGRVDATRIGVSGHSHGGIPTVGLVARPCCRDGRVAAAIVFGGAEQILPGVAFDWSEAPPILVVHADDDAVISFDEGQRIFVDAPTPKGLFALFGAGHGSGLTGPSRAHDAVLRVTVDFWDAMLKGSFAALAALPSDGVPGVADMRWVGSGESSAAIAPATPPRPQRAATASATTDLRAGQRVDVRWSGFVPGRVVHVVQCSAGARAGIGTCSPTTGGVILPDPQGSGTYRLEVVTGRVGDGYCDAQHDDCVIAVNDASLADDGATIIIPISFAR